MLPHSVTCKIKSALVHLYREQLWTLTEVDVVIEDWRWLYNTVRPHRSLGNITPRCFA